MKTKIPNSSRAGLFSGGLLVLCIGVSGALAQPTDAPSMTSPSDPAMRSAPTATATTPPMSSSDSDAAKPALMRSDRHFFKKIARLGEEEVAISRIASDRAINPQVRAFATEMVKAHTGANAELAALAESKGAKPEPRDPVDARKEDTKWLEKKAGDFDKDYLDAIIDGHKDTIDVLEDGADSKDADIAAWSNKMLPIVKGHLAHAKEMKKTLD